MGISMSKVGCRRVHLLFQCACTFHVPFLFLFSLLALVLNILKITTMSSRGNVTKTRCYGNRFNQTGPCIRYTSDIAVETHQTSRKLNDGRPQKWRLSLALQRCLRWRKAQWRISGTLSCRDNLVSDWQWHIIVSWPCILFYECAVHKKLPSAQNRYM